ncbi:hypothetical protein KVR01_004962 [Diaporthe batatas]|uniref:uncharacterized protein n=1 Tax=Diaporthe batatas TaxID=748121 RepID=UPI001D0493AB|nr:uncharacterized protein KVR01_004962 [Diaporthe batatas]KAG8164687.1 hypothetical protein KVR01_004962 [Diaporthe batatas]
MLLPSALSCDPSHPRLQSALFISPPSSPPQLSTQTAIGNLINSCRNLHTMLSSQIPNEPIPDSNSHHLPSPPLANAPSPLSKPRLRRRKAEPSPGPSSSLAPSEPLLRYRIKKRAPPRGANKRRRDDDDDMGRDDEDRYSSDEHFGKENVNIFDMNNETKREPGLFVFKGYSEPSSSSASSSSQRAAPSTPKRQRIAPPDVPRGLTKEDFHKLGAPDAFERDSAVGTNVEVGERGDQWSLEDDHKLVEVVLEKVKNMDLSTEVWDDCSVKQGQDWPAE